MEEKDEEEIMINRDGKKEESKGEKKVNKSTEKAIRDEISAIAVPATT